MEVDVVKERKVVGGSDDDSSSDYASDNISIDVGSLARNEIDDDAVMARWWSYVAVRRWRVRLTAMVRLTDFKDNETIRDEIGEDREIKGQIGRGIGDVTGVVRGGAWRVRDPDGGGQ
ncbi:hypothetical protein U1Q18_010275 [Sarracenia purpurea var. burkii]